MYLPRRYGALVGLCLLGAASCADSSTGGDDAALYTAVIRQVAASDSAELPEMVFVETLPGAEISLDDQTAIVKALDGASDVRFIDDQEEAIDNDQPSAPVRHSGVLVRVGPVERADGSTQVEAIRYVDRDNEQTVCVRVRRTADDWEAASPDGC